MKVDINTIVEIDELEIAKQLARKNNDTQAEWISTFATELIDVCNDRGLDGMQPCMIAQELTNDGITLIKSLNDFILINEAK